VVPRLKIRILRRHGYLSDKQTNAMQPVLERAEVLCRREPLSLAVNPSEIPV
jgi:hypothetical protein